MTILIDTNILIRHLTGDPPAQARKARGLLESGESLLLTDVICAETVYVLESAYSLRRREVAAMVRTVLAFPAIVTTHREMLAFALEHYEVDRLDFAEAYLAAVAEVFELDVVASFDRSLDRIDGVTRIEEL